MTMAGRISIMCDGWIAQTGSPMDIYESPNSRMIAEFIGSVNLFSGEIEVDEVDHVIIKPSNLPQSFYVGYGVTTNVEDKHVWLAVRPEKTIISREQPEGAYNWAKGTVDDIAYLGGISVYYIRLENGQIVQCSMTNRERRADHATWDEEVFISWEDTSGVVLRS
ncbi:MAG: TOBE domain-containing protein, partial [Shewanella sp.]